MLKINNNNFKASVCTLGCRVNQYESDCVISEFTNLGFEIKDFGDVCDVYVINTCTVTAGSDKKSKQMIRRAKKLNKDAVIAVCGCFSQNNPRVFKSDLQADIILGTSEKISIPKLALKILNNKTKNKSEYNLVNPISEYKIYENINAYQSEKTRAYIKIQDGCEANCAYCVIPQVRGIVKSRGYSDIYEEVKRFNDMNYHEIILTGIEISSYRDINSNCKLIDVLEKLNGESDLKNITSIRLSSVEPSLVNKDFIDRFSMLDKIASHFHLSLQSGSTRILNLMRRKYNIDTVIKNISCAKEKIKDLNITADIIVGFPGETDEDFDMTVNILKILNIYHAHIFTYSKRPNTDAAGFDNQIEESVKNSRSRKISEICANLKEEMHKNNLGKEFLVIVEDLRHDGFYTAKTKNFLDVKIKNHADFGTIQKITVTDYDKDFMYGEINKD